jgi:hypothetical protein
MMRLTSSQYQQAFPASKLGREVRAQLELMESDISYTTNGTYNPAAGGDISFTEKHCTYLSLNQNVKPTEYLSNLRLKTKLRR